MKLYIILALVTLAVARPDGEFYDSKYDNFDTDSLIENQRLLKGFIQCFLGEGSCTSDAAQFKKWIPESIQSSCGKCSPKQKILVAKTLKSIEDKFPEEFAKLKKIHDSEGKYTDDINKFIASYSS